MSTEEVESKKKTGLILSGGGARAAYQVGTLKAIGKIIPRHSQNPFEVICGTSAGAINATGIATHATNFQAGVRGMEYVWSHFTADQIYDTRLSVLLKSAARLLFSMIIARKGSDIPVSLLSNEPLVDLLSRILRFDKIKRAIDQGDLHALSITASGYSSGHSVAFFDGQDELLGWQRAHRLGVKTPIKLEHVLASSAIPLLFPAIKINREYFGDGAIRQLAPISPALHLGAQKVLVIGVGTSVENQHESTRSQSYPTPAQMGGHVLNSAFIDSLEGDLERLERINEITTLLPKESLDKVNLKTIDVMSIVPSESIDEIAYRHAQELPKTIRFLLSRSGATTEEGASILSYLLFEQGYCRELIKLGYDDAMSKRAEIAAFLLDH